MEKNFRQYAESPRIPARSKALKAARILRDQSRAQLAEGVGLAVKSIERIENGSWQVSDQKLELLLSSLAMSRKEFAKIEKEPLQYLIKAWESFEAQAKLRPSRPRRNFYKKLTKEARVIRILRERKGLSQTQAGRLCGYARCTFGQLENGRIELPRKRVVHIVSSIGCSPEEFKQLLEAKELPDEALSRCIEKLKLLPMQKLKSIELILESM